MKTLLDPRVLLHSTCADSSVSSDQEFLDRLAAWSESERDLILGPSGARCIMEIFAETGYPQNDIIYETKFARGLLNRIVSHLITRALSLGEPKPPQNYSLETLTPQYISGGDIGRSLVGDLEFMARDSVKVLATAGAHWDGDFRTISHPTFGEAEGIDDPSQLAPSEVYSRIRRYFESRTFYLVGGQRDRNFVKKIEDIGVPSGRFVWIECEKGVSPAIIGKRLSGISGTRSVVCCWTGMIGHAGSNKAETICRKRGVAFFVAEDLPNVLSRVYEVAV